MTDFISTLQGTDSVYEFSRGNTAPLVARPFGLTHWTCMTSEDRWTFTFNQPKLLGVMATRRPSPWMENWGHFGLSCSVVSPGSGEGPFHEAWKRACTYSRDESVFKPHLCQVTLKRYQTRMSFTATERCSIFKFEFPKNNSHIMLHNYDEASVEIDFETGEISGFTKAGPKDRTPSNFASYFVAIPDEKPIGYATFSHDGLEMGRGKLQGDKVGAMLQFSGGTIHFKIATSLISIKQARLNLSREISDFDFEKIVEESKMVWDELLLRIHLDPTTDLLQTFYSCLYRCFLFPRMLHEWDEHGNMIHYSPYNGKVLPGPCATDNGFWDTYRTVYPLLALIAPKELNLIMQGWANACQELEWSPKWANPGAADCMIGTHLDVVVADVVSRGVISWDVESTYEILQKDGRLEPDSKKLGRCGRRGLKSYLELGYVPCDEVDHATSRTMDFAYNDWCLANVTRWLYVKTGKQEYLKDEEEFGSRAANYKNVYCKEVGMMRGKRRDGSWLEPWNEFAWGGPFVEGSAWQGGFAVQHDVKGLVDLFEGKLEEKLDRLLSLPPNFTCGSYGHEIHEMSEMAAVNFGQYAHSNQPVHHILYLYTTACNAPYKTQEWVRRVCLELYSPKDFPGDEDNGEMGAWFVLSSLGLFPSCPGDGLWTLGTSLFSHAQVKVQDGILNIETRGNSGNGTVKERLWNGKSLGLSIKHDEIAKGGNLVFLQ